MSFLDINISAAVFIIAITVLRSLTLNYLPKRAFLVLWGISFCRLTIPFSVPSPFSIYSWLNPAANAASEYSAWTATVSKTIDDLFQVVSPAVKESSDSVLSPIVIVWIVGAVSCTLFFIATHLLCLKKYKTALPVYDVFVNNWSENHKIRRTYQIKHSDRITRPLSYGVCRPVILLPKTTDWPQEQQLEYVLTHEIVHIKRFDVLAKWLLALLLCIYWFNPLVWIMYILANRDIELSCDETVVRLIGGTKKSAYASTLIYLEECRCKPTPLFNNFSKNAVEERVKAIMKSRKTTLAAILVSFILVAAVTIVFVTSEPKGSNSTTISRFTLSDDPAPIAAISGVSTPYTLRGEKLPEGAVGKTLENEAFSNYKFSTDKSFSISGSAIAPGTYIAGDSSHLIKPDMKLMSAVVWADMGQGIQIGFVDKLDSSKQYWSEASFGGSFTSFGTGNAVAIDFTEIPEGEYFVCLMASKSNTENIKSITAVFEWASV